MITAKQVLTPVMVRENLLARGCERDVYTLEHDYVIKIPRTCQRPSRGMVVDGQSRLELRIWQDCPEEYRSLLCPIVSHFEYKDHLVLIMPRLQTLSESEIRKIRRSVRRLQQDINPMVRRVMEYYQYDFSPYQEMIHGLCSRYTLARNELEGNVYNIGFDDNGQLKYVDYGFSLTPQ